MIKGIFLDCGGVMVYPASGNWMQPVGLEKLIGGKIHRIDPALAREAVELYAPIIDEGQLLTACGHEFEVWKEYCAKVNAYIGTGLTEAEILSVARALAYDDGKYVLYDDAREGIERLADRYRVGFLSNALPSMQRAFLAFGICGRLSCFTVSSFVGCRKPFDGIFDAALAEMGLPPEECVFVEDIEENLRAAARKGIRTLRMKRDFYLDWPLPEFEWQGFTASSFADIERLVDAHNAGEIEIVPCSE